MKTILVMSTALDKSIEHTQWGQPLGLAYIAACIRDISDVVIIDCDVAEQYTKTLMREINTDDDLIVGFSANTYTYLEALRLAKMVKEHNPNAHINFGGYHATPLADVILKNREYIDSIIIGDGEIPFRELVNALLNGNDLSNVGSLAYRNGGRIVSNPDAPLPDLDSLPYPARDLLPMEKCFNNFKSSVFHNDYEISRMVYVGANRGCPHYCNFCSIFNKKWRPRDPTNIVDEFEYVKKMYDADSIYLVGDNLNLDSKWFSMLCNEIIRRDLELKWISMTMNPLAINRQVIMEMVDSGCIRIACGFESGSQKMLVSLNKKSSVNKLKSTVELLNNTNIDVAASFILGAPGESEKSLDKTRNFIKESRFETSSACILTPLPGSEIFNKMITIMPKLIELDIMSLEELRKNYVENFCDIDYQRLIEIREEFSSLSKSNLNLFNIL
jgi:radical SAM superfamily enzyme YgiQ (UPF0313 family)